ncbi:MAG: DUF2975 domain-containing protein [Porphyrobacter sp.]|nr:DUF2975 domain-containing protein [Porphyrobacter sp.]
MTTLTKDPLLTTGKVLTILVRIGLVIGMIGLGIAGTVVAIGATGLTEHIVVKTTGVGEVKWAAVLVIFTMLISLGLMYEFVTRLAQIIDTVGKGDPFTLENAARLTRMGWLALTVQILAIPVTVISSWLETHVDEGVFQLQSNISFTGLVVAVLMFILARVFRKGAEMREDLEGTV